MNPDGTGKSNVAHFIITQAKKIGNQLVGTEIFFIADNSIRSPGTADDDLNEAVGDPGLLSRAATASRALMGRTAVRLLGTAVRRSRSRQPH